MKRKIWFKEKYSEDFAAKRLEMRKLGREGLLDSFLEQLASGKEIISEYSRQSPLPFTHSCVLTRRSQHRQGRRKRKKSKSQSPSL